MSILKKLKEIKETHILGYLSVESMPKGGPNTDFGIQVAPDGRIWICVEGVAVLRFTPNIPKTKD
jgi:streptogramin lyase